MIIGNGVIKKNKLKDDYETLINFIENSNDIEILTWKTAGGIILKISSNKIIKEYINIDSNSLLVEEDNYVSSILLKLSYVNKTNIKNKNISSLKLLGRDSFDDNIYNDFIREIIIQKLIFNKSYLLGNYDAICPNILYYDNFSQDNEKLKKIKLLLQNLKKTKLTDTLDSLDFLNNFLNNLNNNVNLGIIVMQFANNYSTLSKNNEQKYKNYAIYELSRLHKYGFSHGDFHQGNVMINTSYNYFDENSGRALIIDFGRSRYINNNNFDLLSYFYTIPIEEKKIDITKSIINEELLTSWPGITTTYLCKDKKEGGISESKTIFDNSKYDCQKINKDFITKTVDNITYKIYPSYSWLLEYINNSRVNDIDKINILINNRKNFVLKNMNKIKLNEEIENRIKKEIPILEKLLYEIENENKNKNDF